jgi:hypothetical protein
MHSNIEEKHEEEHEYSKKERKFKTTSLNQFEGIEGSCDEEQCMLEIVKNT